MANRWFITPRLGSGTDDDSYRPKYADESGIIAWSGHWHDFSADKWSDLPWYPDTMYVARFYADRNKPLNDVGSYDDVWSEQDVSVQEIADFLNEKFGVSLTFEEWELRFYAGGV